MGQLVPLHLGALNRGQNRAQKTEEKVSNEVMILLAVLAVAFGRGLSLAYNRPRV
jgi:hypothetical protein